MATKPGDLFGAFVLCDSNDTNAVLLVTLSVNGAWQHICVTKQRKGKFIGKAKQEEPNTMDMRTAKAIFFKPDESCAEFFPHEKSALHAAPLTRHLWHNVIRDFPMPEESKKVPRVMPPPETESRN